MPSTLSAQLAQFELGHLSVAAAEPDRILAMPDPEAVTQTLNAVWSDLFGLFTETVLETDAEELAWGFVNLFHRAAAKKSGQIDRATDEKRMAWAMGDIIENRPALSRWHPDFKDAFARHMAD